MPVEFSNFHLNDHGRPLTVENAFRFYGAWAGLHDFDFDRLYDLLIDGWGGVTGVTGVTVTGASAWTVELDSTALPVDHTVTYTTTGADAYQGLVVGALDADNHYLVCTEGADTLKVYKTAAGVTTLALALNVPGESASGTYTCSCRPFALGSEESDLWLAISLWRDDKHLLSYTEKLAAPLTGPYHFGLAAYSANLRSYTDVHVPELCVYAEYGTLDPGEAAAGGLQRAIEGRYLRYFCRFDGTLRAFRPKTQASAATLQQLDSYGHRQHTDLRSYKTHVRLMGAYSWGEAADADGLAIYGHRFIEVNNPMLMGENDCVDEAARQLRRLQSEAVTCELDAANLPLVEPEDRLSEPGGDWVVSGFSKEVTPGAIQAGYSLRKYVEGI